MEYEKYNKFVDKHGRMFILLARWAKIEVDGKTLNYVPTVVDLLEVAKEKLVQNPYGEGLLPVAEFERYLETGQLKKVI